MNQRPGINPGLLLLCGRYFFGVFVYSTEIHGLLAGTHSLSPAPARYAANTANTPTTDYY